MSDVDWNAFLVTVVRILPYISIYIFGMILSIVFWKRHPPVSILCLIAFFIMLANMVVGNVVVLLKINHEDLERILDRVAVFRAVFSALAWGLLLTAIFGWRTNSGGKPVDRMTLGFGSKTKELAIFAIGLGLIGAGLTVFYRASTHPAQRIPLKDMAIVCIPFASMITAGILTLAIRNLFAVRFTLAILTIAIFVDAIMMVNPVKWVISAACLFLVWKTEQAAEAELRESQH